MTGPRITASNRRFVVVLSAAIAGTAWAGYSIDNGLLRVVLSLGLLALIIWASARLSVVEYLTAKLAKRPHERQFMKLRSTVDQMLSEIRRMSWTVFDHERHLRDEHVVRNELDAIDERLIALVKQLRTVAGQTNPEDRGDVEGKPR